MRFDAVSPYARRIVSVTVFIAAASALLWGVGRQWREIVLLVGNLDLMALGGAAVAGSVMLVFASLELGLLAHPGVTSPEPVLRTAGIYLLSQPLKYLPGRVWSFAYQIMNIGKRVGNRMAIAASLSQLCLGTFGSLLVLGISLGGKAILLPISFFVVGAWLWRGGIARYLGIAGPEWMSVGQTACVLVLLALEWVAFALVAWLVCKSFSSGGEYSFLMLALYAVAWLVGSLVSITPGGLVVREGGFVVLCESFGIPGEIGGTFAVVARLAFTVSELVTAGIVIAAYRKKLFGSEV